MGNVSSRQEDGATLFLRDQKRLSITSLNVTNSRGRILLQIQPNATPSTRLIARRGPGDDSVVDFVQDPDPAPQSASPFLVRLSNDEDLIFNFKFEIRQTQSNNLTENSDTVITGLTYAFASSPRELDNLVTREFHADPNLHKNSNVQLVGDYGTGGSPIASFEWSWRWRPPRPLEDKGGGWRNTCSFLEYDQRAHRLNTLASFSFWVQNSHRNVLSPASPLLGFDMAPPPKIRVASAQSYTSQMSGMDSGTDQHREPPSPGLPSQEFPTGISQVSSSSTVKVDLSCQKPGEDMSAVEDGPVFRATMKALEQKTGNMRTQMKKVLKKAEVARQTQIESNIAASAFTDALSEAAKSNANAIQPALEHYFERIAKEILIYEQKNTSNLQKLIIDPLTRLYNVDIKQAEAKKKDFEDESREYYSYVGRYLGQRQDSLKEKKRVESDSKYQTKRRNFELKRFDYSSFMQDLHGGRKEQEVLSYLTRFAEAQSKSYLEAAKKVEKMIPQLEALTFEVKKTDKEYQFQRTEREEKRRMLEKSTKTYVEPESAAASAIPPTTTPATTQANEYISDSELARSDSNASTVHQNITTPASTSLPSNSSQMMSPPPSTQLSSSPGAHSSMGIPSRGTGSNKFKGIRDLEEKDYSQLSSSDKNFGQQRKEGLLWALSRPGSHVDPKGLNKQAWHKFWIVLDQGTLSEYSNWKQKLDLHMEPIDLRMASVREARNAERRFCFEVITPSYKRVYQATSEDDMNSWISAINNALQSAVEGRGPPPKSNPVTSETSSSRQDIRSALTGKASPYPGHHHSVHGHHPSASTSTGNTSGVYRRTTVGARPTYMRTNSSSFEDNPAKLLQIVRQADEGNKWCADCGSDWKTEWVSINLGIVLCIECSGIHRSLGTHVSKIRSLTLDTQAFTTDIVELLLQVGNRVSNMVWEAKLAATAKPPATATRDQRYRFINAKYVNREFVEPISTTLSHYSTAEETLLASVKKNDLRGVLYALALRASPNATDRSRATPAIFLALAAADPASPASAAGSSDSSSGTKVPIKPTAFPIAELLVQNGAEIPASQPPFPLSKNASLYWEQKSGRDTRTSIAGGPGTSAITAGISGAGGGDATATPTSPGDILGALPIIGALGSPSQRERERLQKRSSTGNKLSKAPGLDR